MIKSVIAPGLRILFDCHSRFRTISEKNLSNYWYFIWYHNIAQM